VSAGEAVAWLVLVSVGAGLLFYACSLSNERRQACELRGGVWLIRDGVCLDKRLTK
jgi:hypothetical protein